MQRSFAMKRLTVLSVVIALLGVPVQAQANTSVDQNAIQQSEGKNATGFFDIIRAMLRLSDSPVAGIRVAGGSR
jgi:hypothetical protein